MNEQLQDASQKALANMINMANDGMTGAVSFAKAQIPDVIHQMLMWNMITSLIAFSFGVLSILVVVVYFLCMWKASKRFDETRKDNIFFEKGFYTENKILNDSGMVIGTFVLIFFVVNLVVNVVMGFDWIEILVAPKYYLLEQASHLINK